MKKVSFLFLALCILAFSACTSQPKPRLLNLNTITENIPIYSLNITVRKDIDNDGIGEQFFQRIFVEQIDNISALLASKGINTNIQSFKNEFASSSEIIFEEMRITPYFIINRYSWTSQIKPEIRLALSVPLVVMEDGSMILEYSVRKDDPEYEQGYLFNGTLGLQFGN